MRDMRIRRFGYTWIGRFGNSFTRGLSGPVQIVISKSHILRHIQTSIYAPYHRYKGLSNIPNLAGYREDIPDIKQSYIYKHHMFDMADMRI